jgi:hypothetical protein
MVIGRPNKLGFFLSIGIIVYSWALRADEVTCPVCDQSFSVDTDICPNDGTNLELRGIYVKNTNGKTEGKPGSAPGDEAIDIGGEATETSGASKYKRGDAKRRRLHKKKPSKRGYSDRRSRIDSERRSAEADRRNRQREKEAFEKEDRLLMEAFEQRRSQLWAERQRELPEGTKGLEDPDTVREQLVYALGAPITSLGFRMFWMGEDNDSGPVSSAEIEVNLARYWFRAGISTLFGARYVQEQNEFVFLTHLSAGFQWPHRFSPFLVARGGMGFLSSRRLQDDLVYLLTSVGFDTGIDSWITPWIAISVSAGYERCMSENSHWDSFSYKISVGF